MQGLFREDLAFILLLRKHKFHFKNPTYILPLRRQGFFKEDPTLILPIGQKRQKRLLGEDPTFILTSFVKLSLLNFQSSSLMDVRSPPPPHLELSSKILISRWNQWRRDDRPNWYLSLTCLRVSRRISRHTFQQGDQLLLLNFRKGGV